MALATIVALAVAPAAPPAKVAGPTSERTWQLAVNCPKTGEQTSGTNKICFYNCVGSMTAITVRSTQLCPLSIQG
ncbi:MAG TPA: hypothetical protein VG742_22935 [Dongiaceae bacterium]|nr:hypothetical protein [Dongiaceae bacterium]